MRTLDVATAAEILRAGGIVAIPTETVYGLAADASNDSAVAQIFAAKGRPTSHPLIVHVASAAELDGWVREIPPSARRLADVLWPGPLTMIFARGPRAHDAVTGGLDTVALRVPAHPLALELIAAAGPLAAPSANLFGSVSPTTAEHVRADLEGRIDGVVDGGPCAIGLESTIVDVTGVVPSLLRPGGVPRETIEDVLGAPILRAGDDAPRAPGSLASHYAPRARVVAVHRSELAEAARGLDRLAILAVADPAIGGATWIPVPSDPAERARTLYSTLRAIDERGLAHALVELPEDERGVGLAIADRLRRAAGPR